MSDDEWEFLAPYLTLMTPAVLQPTYDMREAFHAVCWLVCTRAPGRYLPGDFPSRPAVH